MIRSFFIVVFTVSCTMTFGQIVRSIDGVNNNTQNIEWGSSGDALYALTDPAFTDSIASVAGADRMNPREISNLLFAQEENISDEENLSDFIWVFGQFIDHEITLIENDITEPLAIHIPENDKVFSPNGRPIGMFRSRGILGTGLDKENPRQYANEITAYIDGSTVYGSESHIAEWLRTYEDGKLKMSEGNMLPWNTITGEFNDPRDPRAPFMEDASATGSSRSQNLYVAGDVRANENPLLLAIHTIFVREHNRLCDAYLIQNPNATDEETYQHARRMVGGIIQSIVYNEWLPAMGLQIPAYNGYRPDVNPQISNVFSAAAFRMGHTLINSRVLRIQRDGEEIPSGSIQLRDAFFNPLAITLAGGVDSYLRGMGSQVQQKMDCRVIDDVRNFLFGTPEMGGMDLAAININRGRERGLADFNTIRSEVGLPRLKNFSELTQSVEDTEMLQQVYGSIDNVDPWVGMLAEDYMPGAMFGNTIMSIMEDQFQRLRDGDKFYYEADPVLTAQEKSVIASTRLRDVIMRNTNIKVMQENVFIAMKREQIPTGPTIVPTDLNAIAYPNPTFGPFQLKIFSESDDTIDVDVYDNLGKHIQTSSIQLIQGDNVVPYEIIESNGGAFYNVVLRKGAMTQVLRVFAQ